MSRLVETLFRGIEQELNEKIGNGSDSHYRAVFSGPPRAILEKILNAAISKGGVEVGNTGSLISPVLLPSKKCSDPDDLDDSGLCSDSHLVKVRTSEKERFLILLPVGYPMNESMETTIQKIGASTNSEVAASKSSFFESLLETALEGVTADNTKGYIQLAKGILAGELVDQDNESRDGASQWGLLERLFDLETAGATRHEQVIAVMGLFYCEPDKLPAYSDYKSVYDALADLLESEGVVSGFRRLQEGADEDVQQALSDCLKHIRSSCKSGSDFKESPTSSYCPFKRHVEGSGIPNWWRKLSIDTWRDLLNQGPPPTKKDLKVSCSNALMPEGRGVPCVVQSLASFEISHVDPADDREIKVVRKVGRTPEEITTLQPVGNGGKITWEDPDPPEHLTSIEYEFSVISSDSEDVKPTKIKVISLDSHKIGVVPYCRSASKIKMFRLRSKARKSSKKKSKSTSGSGVEYEATLEVHGMGLHQVDLYVASNIALSREMVGFEVNSEKNIDVKKPINKSNDGHAVSVIETDEECKYRFTGKRDDEGECTYWINIEADDESTVGVESEFDRLVIENQKKVSSERGGTTIEPPSARASNLQRWILDSEHSWRPIIIGPDFEHEWTEPDWLGEAKISGLSLLQDPRPSHQDLKPPAGFLELRKKLLARIKEDDELGFRLVEEVSFGDLMTEEGEDGFAQLVEQYIRTYAEWLQNDPDSATWCDLVVACKADANGGSINPAPYAIILTPVHPLRLAWQCQAQRVLREALDAHVPCPAASTLDPNVYPDSLALPIRETAGTYSQLPFLAVNTNSDYWQVLWNCNDFDELASPKFESIFGNWFGLTVDGLASGFSNEQVKRSINEVRRIYAAKSVFRVLVESDTSGACSCNDGIEEWAKSNLGQDADDWYGTGPAKLEVIDDRDEMAQPLESRAARMRELSGGTLSWYSSSENISSSDLAILAHLGTANPQLEKHNLRSAVGPHGLSRWRVRRQTGVDGKFIAETRVGKRVEGSPGLAKSLVETGFLLEKRFGEIADAHVFAPNLPALSKALSRASYCAVSSSSLDPACFFGQMEQFYLWDYDLPSYSRRAGENNGYYLLASESPMMSDAIRAALEELESGNSANKDEGFIHNLLVEIANRGMPTLKRITSGGTAALGEVGMLVALRILQGDFISGQPTPSIIPAKDPEAETLTLIVPADPFAGHFDALRRSMGGRTYERPDLLVLSIKFGQLNEPACIQITPIEVKARSQTMSSSERKKSLQQASKFGEFLKELWAIGEKHTIWGIAWRNLLCSWVDYGFRVYGQLEEFRKDPEWSQCHQNVLASILEDEVDVAIDARGRLIVIDNSNQSDLVDEDSDKLMETLVVTHSDAHKIMTSPKESIIPLLVDRLKNWETSSVDPLILTAEGEEEDQGENESNDDIEKESTTAAQVTEGAAKSATTEATGSGVGETKDDNNLERDGKGRDDGGVNTGAPEVDSLGPDESVPGGSTAAGEDEPEEASGDGVRFAVGTSIGGITKREFDFNPSNTELNQLNIGVIGDLGTGKTQLLQALLYNLHHCSETNRGVSPNVLIFDYKKDYTKPLFVEQTGAKVIQPFDIPLNLFDTTNSTNLRNPWLERHLFFSDILSKVFSGIGPKQKQQLKTSIKAAYERAELNGQGAPTIYDVFEKYAEYCGDSFDSPYSIMSNIVDQGIFVDSHEKAVPFSEFCKGVVVIDLGALGQDDDTKNMLVAIFLNLFYENMLKIPKKPFIGKDPSLRSIDSFLLVDEADNIMRYEFDVLRKVLLQGREFGVGVILSSQYPTHFKTAHENYAESLRSWFIHKVPDISAKQLQSMGLTQVHEETVDRIKELEVHECLYRSLGVEGEFMKGHPFFKLIE